MIYWTECLLKPMNLTLTWLDISILTVFHPLTFMPCHSRAEQWGTLWMMDTVCQCHAQISIESIYMILNYIWWIFIKACLHAWVRLLSSRLVKEMHHQLFNSRFFSSEKIQVIEDKLKLESSGTNFVFMLHTHFLTVPVHFVFA